MAPEDPQPHNLTLEQALVLISELDDGAEVPELKLVNRGDRSGEFTGGRRHPSPGMGENITFASPTVSDAALVEKERVLCTFRYSKKTPKGHQGSNIVAIRGAETGELIDAGGRRGFNLPEGVKWPIIGAKIIYGIQEQSHAR